MELEPEDKVWTPNSFHTARLLTTLATLILFSDDEYITQPQFAVHSPEVNNRRVIVKPIISLIHIYDPLIEINSGSKGHTPLY